MKHQHDSQSTAQALLVLQVVETSAKEFYPQSPVTGKGMDGKRVTVTGRKRQERKEEDEEEKNEKSSNTTRTFQLIPAP